MFEQKKTQQKPIITQLKLYLSVMLIFLLLSIMIISEVVDWSIFMLLLFINDDVDFALSLSLAPLDFGGERETENCSSLRRRRANSG